MRLHKASLMKGTLVVMVVITTGVLLGGTVAPFSNALFKLDADAVNGMIVPGAPVHTSTLLQMNDDAGLDAVTSVFTVYNPGPFVNVVSPSSNAYVSMPTVAWEGTVEGVGLSHYEYSLNGGEWVNLSTATEHTFKNLTDGQHTVLIKIVDQAGQESMAAVTFTLDTASPVITINSPSNDTIISSPIVVWQGSDLGTGLSHYECSVDDGAWNNVSTVTEHTFTNLTDGQHTVQVRMFDLAGNIDTAEVTFTLDSIAPVVTIVSPANGSWVNSAVVTWEGSDAGTGILHYEYSLDGGAWMNVSMAIEHDFQGLAPAQHTVQVKAVDRAGLNGSASVTFSLDNLDPVLTIMSPVEGALLFTENAEARWNGTDSGSGVANYSLRFDGGNWIDLALAHIYSLGVLVDGDHTMEVRVFDHAGNFVIEEFDFALDATLPTVSEHGPVGTNVSLDADIFATFSEPMNTTSVSMTVDGLDGTVSWIGNTISFHPSAALSYDTEYTARVSGEDVAGNHVNVTWTFKVTNMGTLIGQIVDASGNLVVGATLTLETGQSTVTNGTGMFSFLVEAGMYNITVTKDGYQATFSSATLAPGQVLTLSALTLTPETSSVMDWWLIVAVCMATAALFILLFATRRKEDGK